MSKLTPSGIRVAGLFIVAVLAIFMCSCIVNHSGNISSGPLLEASDTHNGIALGKSKSYAIFFLATDYSHNMILKAKKNMYQNRPLAEGEYYANFTCDITKKLILGIYYETQVTVSADVLKHR